MVGQANARKGNKIFTFWEVFLKFSRSFYSSGASLDGGFFPAIFLFSLSFSYVKAAGIIVKLIQETRFSSRGVLMSGQPGTGKTAIAMGTAPL